MPGNIPHVVFYLYALYGGGAERAMVNLMCSFVEQGVKVDLALNRIEGPYLSEIPPEVRILELNGFKNGFFKLRDHLRKEKPLVLLSCMYPSNEIAILVKLFAQVSTRIVVCEQNTLSIQAQHSSADESWSPILARFLYPWADGIIAASQGVAQDLTEVTRLPRSRIRVIYNPIITPQLREKSTHLLDHPWFKLGEPPVILGVGRLEPQKNFPMLIEAFAQVRKERIARLMILGEGSEKENLEALVQELGLEKEVALLGFQTNPYFYMAKASIFALSSDWEGFGNVIVEAMALGTPVVSTNCPNGPAEILDNGKYGYLVPVGNNEAMATAILNVLSGDVKQVDSAWLEQFTREVISRQYLNVLGAVNND